MPEKPDSKLVRVEFGRGDIRSLSPADVKKLGLQDKVVEGDFVEPEDGGEPDAQPSGSSAAERRASRAKAPASTPGGEPAKTVGKEFESDETHPRRGSK